MGYFFNVILYSNGNEGFIVVYNSRDEFCKYIKGRKLDMKEGILYII